MAVTMASISPSNAAQETGFRYPILRIPQMAEPPSIDGLVKADEWQTAMAITGVAGNPLGKPFMLPQAQQVHWYLGFHRDLLYIGMRSPHPKGTFPAGRIKEMDDSDVLWGDHTEIQILTNKREDAGRPGKGFYKIMTNGWGAMHDAHMYNGTPGTEDFWSTGGEIKCQVDDSMWQMEMAVQAERIKLPRYHGQSAVVQLVRASGPGGIYFAGLVGGSWMAWQKFAEASFDAKCPAVQLERIGEVMAGDVDTIVAVTGCGRSKQEVVVEVAVEDGKGEVLFQDKRQMVLAPGQTQRASFERRGLAVTDVDIAGARNHYECKVTWQDGRREHVLFHNRLPFMKLTGEWRRRYLDPWLAARPRSGEWDAVFAYLPYSHKAQAKVDVDFFGMDPKIRSASRFNVEIRDSANRGIAEAGAEMTGGAGSVFFNTPDLADGEYRAAFRLTRRGGATTVAEKTVTFVRKRYPWERNTLGLSDEVIPPFMPLVVNPDRPVLTGGGPQERYYLRDKIEGDAVYLWGRIVTVHSNGLPRQVWTTPPSGSAGEVATLLAAPIRLEFVTAGKAIEVQGESSRITSAMPHRVDIKGTSVAGALRVSTASSIEYDGWCQVELRIEPTRAAKVDAIDLLVDMRQQACDKYRLPLPVDSLYVQRLGGGVDNTYQDGIPAKPGVHYRSTVLYPPTARTGPADVKKDWKSFAPICFIGNGDRGMWFFAWSDKGYVLKDDEAMLRVERLRDGTARLRVRLIAGPVTLDRPRTLTFALQPAPIKRNDPEYRTRIAKIMHDTSGYRYYGDSVDSYALHTERDYSELRRYLMYGNTLQPKEAGSRYGHWAGRLGKMLRDGRADRIMMYGSQWMTGLGAEEFDSFGGEWLGRNNWKPKADMKFSDKWNYGHTVQWNTPRKLTPARVNWPQSMLDFFVWHHERLIDKSGFNGTWWDNCYSGTVTEYDPELDRLDAKWNIIYRRQLCKRLNVIGWQHMRQPCWAMNTQVEMPWCQVYWLVEGFWGPSSKDISSIDHFGSLDFVRAALRPKSTTMTCKTTYFGHYRGSTPEKDQAMRRSADAILLVHDVQPHHDKELVHRLKYAVDYASTDQCLFMGYWLTGPVVQPAGRGVVAAVYQNPTRRTAVLAFMNTWSRAQNLGGSTFDLRRVVGARESVTLHRAYDLETDEPVRVMYDDGRFRLLDQLPIGRHEFRVIAVVAK